MSVDLLPVINTPLRFRAFLASVVPAQVATKDERIARARENAVVWSMLYRPQEWTAYRGDRYARRLTIVERVLLALVGGRTHG